jgi:hypothetical protein
MKQRRGPERDAAPRGKSAPQRRKPRPLLQRLGWVWRLSAAILLVALHTWLFPVAPRIDVEFPTLGEIPNRDILAPFAFTAPYLEQDIEMRRLQRMLVEPPVVQSQPAQERLVRGRLDTWREIMSRHAAMSEMPLPDRVALLALRLPELSSDDLSRAMTREDAGAFFATAAEAFDALLAGGVADFMPPGNYRLVRVTSDGSDRTVDAQEITPQAEAASRLERLLMDRGLGEDDAAWGARLLRPLVRPNLVYDDEATRDRRMAARQAVLVQREFLDGERIVEQGVRVTDQDALYLETLTSILAARSDTSEGAALRQAARSLLALCILLMAGWVIRLHARDVLTDVRRLALCTATLAIVLFLSSLCLGTSTLGPYAVPIVLLSVLSTVLFQARLGYVLTVLVVAWLTFVAGFQPAWMLTWLVTGFVAVTLMTRIRQRDQFYQAIAVLASLQLLLVLLIRAAGAGTPAGLLQELLVAALAPVASIALALFLLPIVEPLVGACSDLTLLELSDLNHPLLKKMALESQGTFHHSQVVGQLAEHAAHTIGANSLRTRVGALFHDIGKMAKPEYYVENQGGGPNKHDELSPSMSALVVASHVKDGIELARRWRLPEQVVAFIPEHHGTSIMKFFYSKALNSAGDAAVKVDDFRYPGPKPQSRETAILMLADAVEAATRSLAKPTPGRIREVVKQIADERMLSGELDECGLTLADIAKVRQAFVPLLTGIHHSRIAYPGQKHAATETTEKERP